ncbi:hypothetical protein ABT56_19110 [Photobacterium aquae]|uniref:Conjugal transfer protein TraH n=1 Tax=Photobacterium aquae TaxID=1195763 RepID=A0A0J1GVR7_9GAMM|nr:conjugal transfer protein TraH [Photobacterium aquae]KLV03539.1 hypothetical protein ABT56_19110 [Photobacterium aquae]
MKKKLGAAILLLTVIQAEPVSASFDNEMESMFDAMVNTTEPNAYKSARRGVVSAGSLYSRFPVKNVSIANATAPKITAGCSGINIYGGSFSTISSDEAISTLKAIGTNSLAYGVKLALANSCAICEQVMSNLEAFSQALNKMNINSCEAAEGMVNAGLELSGIKNLKQQSSSKLSELGIVSDFNKIWNKGNTEGISPTVELKNNAPTQYSEIVTGNLVWRAMHTKSNKDMILNAFNSIDDEDLLLAMMTMTGTTVINHDTSNEANEPQTKIIPGYRLSLFNLMAGGNVTIYECSDGNGKDQCLSPVYNNKKTNFKGMTQRIKKGLQDISDGFIENNGDWSNDAKVITSIRSAVGQQCINQLRLLSSIRYKEAKNSMDLIVSACAERVAMDASKALADNIFEITERSLDSLPSSQREQAISQLELNKKKLNSDFNHYSTLVSEEAIFKQIENYVSVSKVN